MPNEKKSANGGGGAFSGDAGIFLFLIIIAALAISVKGSNLSQKNGINIGSPTSVGTVEDNISKKNKPSSFLSSNSAPNFQSGQSSAQTASAPESSFMIFESSARNADPNQEYIDIYAVITNGKPVPMSSWTVENSKGNKFIIGGASYLARAGEITSESGILLAPGEILHIITGSSPLGFNFRTNICTGYFDQFHNFYPSLRENCPRPETENSAQNLDNVCYNFLKNFPRCRTPINVANQTTLDCQNYVNQELSYTKCVDTHRNDKDFWGNEWYLYLGRTSEIWKYERETVTLRDQAGKIVASYSY